ncbi:MAG: hypothetical protein QOH67_3889, partial [Hyphomicrobiales bacterium]|nr:hypothetical protein [Hyphomicrobiales bacterium]
ADAQIIKALMPLLLDSARKTPPPTHDRKTMPMTIEDVRRSLETPSAKIWPYEYGAPGQLSQPIGLEALWVARWEANEAEHKTRWRWTPDDRDLVIKGALMDANGGPHVPAAKADRARQIHLYGFT